MYRMLALFLALFIAAPAQAFDASKVDGATLERLAGAGQIVVVEEAPDGKLTLVTAGQQLTTLATVLGFIAVAMASANVVGGFMVTHRMLGMFQKKK